MSRSRSNTSSTCDSFTQWDRAYPEETREYLARNAARCRPWAENVRPGAPSTSNSPTRSANAYRRRAFDPLQLLHHYQHNRSTISVHSSASQPSRSDRHQRTESHHRSDRGSSRDDSQISPTHRLSPPIIPQYYTPRHVQVQSHSDPIPPRTANFPMYPCVVTHILIHTAHAAARPEALQSIPRCLELNVLLHMSMDQQSGNSSRTNSPVQTVISRHAEAITSRTALQTCIVIEGDI